MSPHTRRFQNPRFYYLILTLTLITVLLGLPPLHAAEVNKEGEIIEIRSFLEHYFQARYLSLQNLRLEDDFVHCFAPENLNQPALLSEPDRFQALLTYRLAQSDDLRLEADWSFELRILSLDIKGQEAIAIIEEDYHYTFVSSPTGLHSGTITHRLVLRQAGGEWLIASDDYRLIELPLRELEKAFTSIPLDKESFFALAEIIGALPSKGQTWPQRFAVLMRNYPGLIVVHEGWNSVWLNGQILDIATERDHALTWHDGQKITLNTDYPLTPQRLDGELYLPARTLLEKAGAEVEWDEESNSTDIRLGLNQLFYYYNSREVRFNSANLTLERPIPLMGSRAYFPADLMARLLSRRLHQDGRGTVIFAPQQTPAETVQNLLPAISDLFDEDFYVTDLLCLSVTSEAQPMFQGLAQEFFGMDADSIATLWPTLSVEEAYSRLMHFQTDLILTRMPTAEDLRKASLSSYPLEIVPLSDDIAAVYRRQEAENSTAVRLVRYLKLMESGELRMEN